MKADALIAGLPGEALVREGLSDLEAGRLTIPACLVNIARTRLSRAGLIPAGSPPSPVEPELELYRLLRQQPGDAYSRYNSLLRELASFNNAIDRRVSRESLGEV